MKEQSQVQQQWQDETNNGALLIAYMMVAISSGTMGFVIGLLF